MPAEQFVEGIGGLICRRVVPCGGGHLQAHYALRLPVLEAGPHGVQVIIERSDLNAMRLASADHLVGAGRPGPQGHRQKGHEQVPVGVRDRSDLGQCDLDVAPVAHDPLIQAGLVCLLHALAEGTIGVVINVVTVVEFPGGDQRRARIGHITNVFPVGAEQIPFLINVQLGVLQPLIVVFAQAC